MIKLIPCNQMPKRELIQALLDGRTFSLSHDSYHNPLHWDDNHPQSQVRLGKQPWNWRGMQYLCEITESHWYDNIPEEGVLCWVDDSYEHIKDHAVNICSIDGGFKEKDTCVWNYATPVSPSECYQDPV